ncbi:MAG: hypothetical protein V3U77_01730 [bacterium]
MDNYKSGVAFTYGDEVMIRGDVSKGAFEGEFSVVIHTESDLISGFVRDEDMIKVEGAKGYIRAIVRNVTIDTITVRILGSFFTTNGIARLSRDWAKDNVKRIAAA